MTTPLVGKFYNLQVSRDPAQVERELRAILTSSSCHVLGVCEATGYQLPGVEGFKVIRDTSTPSRANVAAYVTTEVPAPAEKVQWHDCVETWTRTDRPGTHEPRSWLELRLGDVQVMVGHQPPKHTDNTKAAQQEGVDLCVRRTAPWTRDDWDDKTRQEQRDAIACPRIVLADWNRGPNEAGPGPLRLADRIEGWQAGGKIDAAVIRGGDVDLDTWFYTNDPGGVPLESDHRWGAFVVKLDVEERWT